jgi:cytochrome P450
MKEAMRCHPGVSYPLERLVPAGGETICGHYLKEGTIVGVNAAVIHRDTTIFGEDALAFNPERWLGPDEERIKTMDRNLMTVRVPLSCAEPIPESCADFSLIVWIRLPNMHRQEHIHHGNGQACSYHFARV